MANGSLPSAGTKDTRVDRPEEGLPGLATTDNPTANPPTRATFDAGLAAGGERAHAVAQVDTSGHLITPWNALKRALPGAWGFAEEGQTVSGLDVSAATNGDPVATVSFEEAGAGARYSFASGNTGGAFAINATTGAVTVANAGALTVGQYKLVVAVVDNSGFEDQKTVTVNTVA